MKPSQIIRIVPVALVAVACASQPKIAPVARVADEQVKVISAGQNARPVQFKKMIVKLRRGARIGTLKGGIFCLPFRPLTYRGRFGSSSLTAETSDVFREELEKANYRVVGDPNALFDDPSKGEAELLIAGQITSVNASVCYPLSGYGNTHSGRGNASLEVEWQIYSRLERKVLHKVTTRGASSRGGLKPNIFVTLFLDAFSGAARNLLADVKFHELVTEKTQTAQVAPPASRIDVKLREKFSGPVTSNMSKVRLGVVTVYAGGGHGSGFFIGQKGYVLTNEHVVGGAKFVKLKLTTGREILGEVIQTNRARDVALIKTEGLPNVSLPVFRKDLPIGSEVFAVGAPLEDDLSATVSRGILSAYRTQHGQQFIQSDVNVLPGNSGGPLLDKSGNVIGITVKGRVYRGRLAPGVNFFVPIRDALSRLGIAVQDAKNAKIMKK